ncbi:MAG: 5-carboxymethyl-2-hydroxymuconate Delta-isomerase [Colwelliaceae bacterium]|nr:5-carboxymethyl-2-hydroxymuconate Delta-isomerase [Colwelliaceae bacterium]
MPHCIIEYSQELSQQINISQLNDSVFRGADASNLFTIDAIKVRALPYQDYIVGENEQGFIHVSAKILKGRTTEQKQLLSQAILSQILSLTIANVSVSVEVLDIDTDSYVKQSV